MSLGNQGIRLEERRSAATRAYELRDRLPEMESLLAEAFYNHSIRSDVDAAIRAYEGIVELDPEHRVARNNLSVLYRFQGRFQESERLLDDLLDEEAFQIGVNSLAAARLAMGEVEGAIAALDWGVEAMPEVAYQFENRRVALMVALGDLEQAADLAMAFTERFPGPRDLWRRSYHVYLLNASGGRLEAAAEAIEGRTRGDVYETADARAHLAMTRGDSTGAARLLIEACETVRESTPPRDRRYAQILPYLVRLGERDRAALSWKNGSASCPSMSWAYTSDLAGRRSTPSSLWPGVKWTRRSRCSRRSSGCVRNARTNRRMVWGAHTRQEAMRPARSNSTSVTCIPTISTISIRSIGATCSSAWHNCMTKPDRFGKLHPTTSRSFADGATRMLISSRR